MSLRLLHLTFCSWEVFFFFFPATHLSLLWQVVSDSDRNLCLLENAVMDSNERHLLDWDNAPKCLSCLQEWLRKLVYKNRKVNQVLNWCLELETKGHALLWCEMSTMCSPCYCWCLANKILFFNLWWIKLCRCTV